MKRKPVFLAASIAELARYALLSFAAFDAGIAFGSPRGEVFRYSSSAQLLCALGFFFLWLDLPRYAQFARLLIVAKGVGLLLAAIPFIDVLVLGRRIWYIADPQLLGPAAYAAIAAIDLFGLGVLALSGLAAADSDRTRS